MSIADKLQKKSSGRKASAKQVRLRLVYLDFWSSLKLSFFVALAIGIVTIVAAALLWIVLNSTGIFGKLDSILADILGNPVFTLADDFSFAKVMTFAGIIAVVNTIIFTVLGAIAAVLYNMIVKITGGILVGYTNA